MAVFGGLPDGRPVGNPIRLPKGAGSIRIEVDARVLGAAGHVWPDPAAARLGEPGLGGVAHLDDALAHLIAQAETRIGRPLSEMSRADKQQLVRYLDDRGAFALRKAVEHVAEILGVSRFTVYNYLDSVRAD